MTDLNVNFVNILGKTDSSKEETPSKTEHESPPKKEPAEESDSAEKQSVVLIQTHRTISQRLSEGKQSVSENKLSTKQEWTLKVTDDVIGERQTPAQSSSCMCVILKAFLKAA